jgi:5-methylthioribose kinase
LTAIAHEHPDLFSASLTNLQTEVKYYGPKVSHVSFFNSLEYLKISLIIWYTYFSRYSSDFQEETTKTKKKDYFLLLLSHFSKILYYVRQSSPLSFADMNHAQELLVGDSLVLRLC